MAATRFSRARLGTTQSGFLFVRGSWSEAHDKMPDVLNYCAGEK